MHRSAQLFFVLASLLCSTCLCAAYEPNVVLITLRANSTALRQWQQADRSGSLPFLTEILGQHATEPYVLNSTLIAVAHAHARKNITFKQRPADRAIARIAVVRYNADIDPALLARKLSSLPDVEVAEPLAQHHIVEIPDDPDVDRQYYHDLVKSFEAWDKLPTDSTIVVGIVDTGIDTTHADLHANVWHNSLETGLDGNNNDKRSNGIDDDANGFVDDWFGWDFVGANGTATDNSPLPGHLHGTHVGGIVAAVVNNATGGAGVGKNIRVMAVKVGRDDPNSISVGRTSDGILYAASMGASIINCSFGSASPSLAETAVMEEATALGALVVAAAGTDGLDMAFFPAAYPQVLSVAATDEIDEIAFFSNTHNTVDVCAPGVAIYSTTPNNTYQYLDGTSMASPVAAAVAAMVRLKNPTYTSAETKATVMSTCDNIDSANAVFLGRYGIGRVNALSAVSATDPKWVTVSRATFVDSDGDSFFEPGDRLRLTLELRNELAALGNAYIKITNAPAAFASSLINDSIVVGQMARGEIRTLSEEINIDLPLELPFNGEVRLLVQIFDSSRFVSRGIVAAIVNTTFRTLAVNDVTTTVNSVGNVGFNDYPSNVQGVGLTYKGGPNLLFEGALMIGVQPLNLPNVARNATSDSKDTLFHAIRVTEIRTDSVPSGARVTTSFSDIFDPFSIGIDVTENTYALTADSVRNTIIVSLDIYNRVDTTIRDLYVSQFYDFDIGPSGASNGCAWMPKEGLGLFQNTVQPELPLVGIAMISPIALNFYALDNDGDVLSPSIYDNFLRAEKWLTMSNGIGRRNSRVTDASAVIGAGPFSLAPGERQQVCFVVAAGESYALLTKGVNSARGAAREMGLNAILYSELPSEDKVIYLEGSPLITSGTHNIKFVVGSKTAVYITMIDILGSTIATVLDDREVFAGTHTRTISIPNVAQGTYFLRMTTYASSTLFAFGMIN